ncbi:pre-mRNA 3'-end-processing factor FIP1 isoform X10 [Gopherus flavomarginatus]|uniref:pre-mRNA 3'-end-processing factor FIP1 isoform X10 n=1 Tax=Gopherus evgoodei TaxID=1825980 RepID=UPI0011CF28E2|nr:pre-mRNA 3'-end-processing factor FIP1 isoform X10 [Gopherus evgoodei]XP_050803626.1 pre-mRNA 3'-end-processing factor FIP1 isoform X10 [Gopherus flavomarginatus]
MSTGEVERLAADLSGTGGDEEEEWLYGDENEPERPEEQKASAPPPSANEEEAAENGVVKTKVTEAEDDSDSDSDDDEDDVHVTIGDIKTGAPQYGYGTAPVNLNIKTGGRVYGSSGAKVKGVDLDAPGSINGVPLLEVDLDSFEDKPWRKPGADLSDYFNYGFNEDTWKAYCEKQKRIRMGLEILPVTSTTNKIMAEDNSMEVTPGAEIQDGRYNLFKVQQGRTGNMEKEVAVQLTKAEFTSPPPLFKSGIPTNSYQMVLKSNSAGNSKNLKAFYHSIVDVTDDGSGNILNHPVPLFPNSRNSTSSQSQTSTASRKASSGIGKWQERYGRAESPELRRLSGTIDVIGQTITISRVEGRRRANENSNIQVLSERSSADVDSFTKPPPFFPPGAPPTHLPPPPFLPPPPTVSTAPPLIPPPGSAPSWPSLVDTSKQWDYYARREKDRERERERDRERDRDRDRDRERERTRERDRERDHSPTPSVFNSDEERYRYREYAERGYERHRTSREKEERHRERRHREKEETRHKSSRSNSRRRHDSEEGDSHRRHKHKKSKRSKEGKEASGEPAPEQENTEAAPVE